MDKRLLAFSLLLVVGGGCAASEPAPAVDVTTNVVVEEVAPVVPPVEDDAAADVDGVEGDTVTIKTDVAAETAVVVVTDEPEAVPSVRAFAVSGDNFLFAPTTMSVKRGDTVRITFTNAEGFHDLKIDEFNAATAKLAAGASETIEFVADQAGSFEYYCSVGSHRAMGMKGTLTVTE